MSANCSRTLGFRGRPGHLRVIAVVPPLSRPVFAVTTLWMLCAMVVAVRQALDYTSTARASRCASSGWY